MKKQMKKLLLINILFGLFLFAFADEIELKISKLDAAKILVQERTENVLSISPNQKENAKTALEILNSLKFNDEEKEIENLEKSYNTVISKCYLILEQYDQVISLYNSEEKKGGKNISDEMKYYVALSYFQKKNFNIIIETIKPENKESKNLLAQAYVKLGNYSEALKIFEQLLKSKQLSENGKMDYAKILYNQKQYKKVIELISGINTDESNLISGHCCLAQKQFTEAAGFYSKVNGNEQALFLKAYALNKAGKYSESAKEFEKYVNTYSYEQQNNDAWNLCITNWLLAGNISNAEKACEKYLSELEKTNNSKKIQEAVFRLGDIYSDQKKFDKAVDLYQKYAKQKNDFSAECMYRIADCYVNEGNVKLASKTFEEVYNNYPEFEHAEEALFRSGEILYINGLNDDASQKLYSYITRYKTLGKYYYQASYYNFDSRIKKGQYDKGIMFGQKIIDTQPESPYRDETLLQVYEKAFELQLFEISLKAAQEISEKTNHKDQTLEKNISLMKKILQGGNQELLLAEAAYESAGGKTTLKGRENGTKLAMLYFVDEETKTKAVKLAAEILAIQEKDISNERDFAVENALILAEYFYEENRKAEAAENYLKAAEYSRIKGDETKAALSLYTATECFVHLGKKGNAEETAKLLNKLYPDSKYSQAVRSLLK